VEELALAVEQVSEPGADIRLLGAVFVPDDEICFYLCQAASADTVRAAVTHARLPFDRIAEAVSIRPSEADSCSALAPPISPKLRTKGPMMSTQILKILKTHRLLLAAVGLLFVS